VPQRLDHQVFRPTFPENDMLRTIRMALAGLILAAACATATAQTTAMRGTIEKADGNVLTLKSSDGAAMPLPDGSQKALEVHIFAEQMRGTGEGHRPYAPVPNGTMTNGAVSDATVAGVDGSTILVKYNGGEKKIIVPPNTPIVRYEIGGKADLKPGARVTVNAATKKPDGTLEAARINVVRDSAAP
jgi:uncharacterized protein GlcG (DUF336 family)